MTSSLGLPECVHNGTLPPSNHIVVPKPSLWINGLSHCPERLEGVEVMLLHCIVPEFHEGSNGSGSSVELVHFVLFYNCPEP